MNLLLHANATYALTAFQIIIKHQGNSLLYLGGTGNNENFLHYLSMPEELQKKQDHHSYSFTPCQDMVGHHLAFNFTYEQLQKLLSNFTVDKQALNCKNCEGDTPLHKAIKNGNVGLIKWMVETNKIDYAIINGHGRTALELASLAGEEIHNLIKTHAECMPSPTVKPLVANNPATLHFNRQSPPAESFNQLNTFSAA